MTKISTGPIPLDWEVYAGDRNTESFAVDAAGVPVNLTGATFLVQARAMANSPTIAATAVVTPIDLALGTFTVSWDGEALRTLLAGENRWSGVWDLQVLESGQTLPRTLLRGTFTVVHDVARTGS